LGRSPRGLHKTEKELIDFIETVYSTKSHTFRVYFLAIIKNKNKREKNFYNLNFLLLIGASDGQDM
jgi:hypothetical protein